MQIQTSPRAAVVRDRAQGKLSRGLVLLLAAACGLIVATNYYIQPLLGSIATEFGVSAGEAGFVNTLIQAGQALGFLLIVPLGDTRDRRGLIVFTLLLAMLSVLGIAMASSLSVVAVAGFALGLTTVASQIIVPFAASLAAPEERGKVVGMVMSGLLLGILLARTIAGAIGDLFGWRVMFWLAAAIVFVLALVLRAALPADPARPGPRYTALLRSMWTLWREQPVLREASILGALSFATFSAFWVTLTFFLESPVYGLSSALVGLFGLIGAAGAVGASLAGHLADRFSPRTITGIGLLMTLGAFLIFWAFGTHVLLLVIGIVLLDLGIQGAHIANQTRIYALGEAVRSRINTIYITTYFVGGAVGSALANVVWGVAGWAGVCAVCTGLLCIALAVWARARHENV